MNGIIINKLNKQTNKQKNHEAHVVWLSGKKTGNNIRQYNYDGCCVNHK